MMTKNSIGLLFLFSFLFFPLLVNAQYGRLKVRLANSISVVTGGEAAYRTLEAPPSNSEYAETIDARDGRENFQATFRGGFDFHWGLSHSFALKAGIRYANPGFSIKRVKPFDTNIDVNAVHLQYVEEGNSYRYRYQMLEFPIGIKYSIGGGICKPYIEMGVAPSLYLGTIIKEENNLDGAQRSLVKENINTWNYMAFASVGGNFSITEYLYGFTQLVGRYQLNSLRKHQIEERLFGLGLEVGLRYFWD